MDQTSGASAIRTPHTMSQVEAITEKTVATGAGAEAIAGAVALVLAILGLAGIFPPIMSAIAVIAAGAAFLFQGAAVAARHTYLQRLAGGEHAEGELVTGTSAEILGGTLLFGSPATYRVSRAEPMDRKATDYIAREIAAGAAGAQALIGIGSATLGILALVGMAPETLVLVAVLAVGASGLLSGGALTAKMVGLLYR